MKIQIIQISIKYQVLNPTKRTSQNFDNLPYFYQEFDNLK